MADTIVATYLVRVTLRSDAEPEPAPPTNDSLEATIVAALEVELGLDVRASAERTDQ